jgi:hypothetical protein
MDSSLSFFSFYKCAAVIDGSVIIHGTGDKFPSPNVGFRYGLTSTNPFIATPKSDCR